MTLMQRRGAHPEHPPAQSSFSDAARGGLLSEEDVLGEMVAWMSAGQRAVLVTLVNVDGAAPRQPGAQMAVAEDGRFVGYLSGGCLEQAVALEAEDVLLRGKNRLVRYGKGSPYMDIRLPCGSGLDVYFDQAITKDHLAEVMFHRLRRAPVVLRTDLGRGVTTVALNKRVQPIRESRRVGNTFERSYLPALQLLLVGGGPGLVGIATLAAALGISLRILPQDEATSDALASIGSYPIMTGARLSEAIGLMDYASCAVLCFHEHEREPEILGRLLKTDCYYVGALGNRAVHANRLAALAAQGISDEDCSRLRAPLGAIPGAKSKATLAVGVLMEIMAEAKARNLVA